MQRMQQDAADGKTGAGAEYFFCRSRPFCFRLYPGDWMDWMKDWRWTEKRGEKRGERGGDELGGDWEIWGGGFCCWCGE